MKEKIEFTKIVKKFLPEEYCKNNDIKIKVSVNKPKVEIDILDKNERVLFFGLAVCSPEDKWDTSIGLFLALARLKTNINTYFYKQKKKNKTWIPKLGDVYYIPYMDVLTRQIYATKIIWTDGDLDFIRLSLGNIYRTEREARKAIRRNVLNGRHIMKENRNNE